MGVREQIAMYLDQIEDFELLMCVLVCEETCR